MKLRQINVKLNKAITDKNCDIVTLAGKYKVLTIEEEVDLAEKVKKGDQEARDKMICHNLRFVVSVANQYRRYINGSSIEMSDLISEGIFGLIRAVEIFDITKGFKFISYAVWWIRQSIIKYCGENYSAIRLPANVNTFQIKVLRIKDEFCQANSREATDYEILEILQERGIKQIDIDVPEIVGSVDDYLKNSTNSERENRFIDLVKAEEENTGIESESRELLLKKLEAVVNPKKKEKIKTYVKIFIDIYYSNIDVNMPETYETLAKKYGICRERIRQIHDYCIKKLKKASEEGIINTCDFF